MRARVFVSAAALGGTLIACGGGGSGGGSSATGPTPTPSSLSLSPATDFLKLKASETFTATLTMSNGSTQAVTPAWRSSNTAVITIDSGGRATGVASGSTSITAEHQGITSAARSVRVAPDYQGTWRGEMAARSCSATGEWAEFDACEDLEPESTDTLRLSVTQVNATLSAVTLDLGGFAGTVSGSIADNGTLVLTGNYLSAMDGVPFRIVIHDWQTTSMDNAAMTGRFTFTMEAPGLISGEVRVEADLRSVTKTSATLLSGQGTTTGRLAGVLRALRRR